MGACVSADDLDIPPNDIPPMTVAERQKSLVDFVRALSGQNTAKENTKDIISSVDELTAAQEAFLSRHKMVVYSVSDPMNRASTFDHIEDDFFNVYHKKLLRKVLYELYKIK